MEKVFTTTGLCVPGVHYMVDTTSMIEEIVRDYIAPGRYFTINRGRQYGKTTTLNLLKRRLRGEYTVIATSFQGIDDEFSSNVVFVGGLFQDFAQALASCGEDLAAIFTSPVDPVYSSRDLSRRVTRLCRESPFPVVLMIDEVDRASNNEVFVNFLALLREKFLQAAADDVPTFHAVVLAGVTDIRNLKSKIRPEAEHSVNSPWNIAVPFTVEMAFAAAQIATMLDDYEADHRTGMDVAAVAARIEHYSSGYPFLVSRLCQILDATGELWTPSAVDRAESLLVKETNTLFQSLTKHFADDQEFGGLVNRILHDGDAIDFNPLNPEIDRGIMYGALIERGGKVAIANRTFEGVLYNYITSTGTVRDTVQPYLGPAAAYVHDGRLDMAGHRQRDRPEHHHHQDQLSP